MLKISSHFHICDYIFELKMLAPFPSPHTQTQSAPRKKIENILPIWHDLAFCMGACWGALCNIRYISIYFEPNGFWLITKWCIPCTCSVLFSLTNTHTHTSIMVIGTILSHIDFSFQRNSIFVPVERVFISMPNALSNWLHPDRSESKSTFKSSTSTDSFTHCVESH